MTTRRRGVEDVRIGEVERTARRVAVQRFGLSPTVVESWSLERLLQELRGAVDRLMQMPDDVAPSALAGVFDRAAYGVTPQQSVAVDRGWTLTRQEYERIRPSQGVRDASP